MLYRQFDPVFSSNNKLKRLYGIVEGKPRHHPEGVCRLTEDTLGNDNGASALAGKLMAWMALVMTVESSATAPDLVMRSSRVGAAMAFAASDQRGAEAIRELKRRRE
jgi:hypothetical protein